MRLRLIEVDDNASMRAAPAELGYAVQRLDVRDLGARLRLWSPRRTFAAFARRLRDAAPPPGNGPILTLLGSGDFHHLTAALLAPIDEPFTLLHFDNHPDWVRLAPRHHCGSWVNRALELPSLARVVTIGPCSKDLVCPEIKGGNVRALANGRIELYPWRAAPTRIFRRMESRPCCRREGRHLVWRNVGAESLPAFLDDLRARIPTDAIWFSIDKDVLRPEDAGTNWDQGEMPLEALLEGVRRLARGKQVLGADLCGDYSPRDFSGNIAKRIEAWQEGAVPPDAARIARNVDVNRAIIATLGEVMG